MNSPTPDTGRSDVDAPADEGREGGGEFHVLMSFLADFHAAEREPEPEAEQENSAPLFAGPPPYQAAPPAGGPPPGPTDGSPAAMAPPALPSWPPAPPVWPPPQVGPAGPGPGVATGLPAARAVEGAEARRSGFGLRRLGRR